METTMNLKEAENIAKLAESKLDALDLFLIKIKENMVLIEYIEKSDYIPNDVKREEVGKLKEQTDFYICKMCGLFLQNKK